MNSDNSPKVLELKKYAPPSVTRAGAINLVIQGKPVTYEGMPDLASLLESRGEDSLYVNVRINGEILESRDFENIPVEDGDHVDFLYFMGGGTLVQPDRRRD